MHTLIPCISNTTTTDIPNPPHLSTMHCVRLAYYVPWPLGLHTRIAPLRQIPPTVRPFLSSLCSFYSYYHHTTVSPKPAICFPLYWVAATFTHVVKTSFMSWVRISTQCMDRISNHNSKSSTEHFVLPIQVYLLTIAALHSSGIHHHTLVLNG